MSNSIEVPEFDSRSPIPYMARTRSYYSALGYGAPYTWAHFDDVPFHRLSKRLDASCVALVTTAALYQPDKGNQGPGATYNADAKFYDVYAHPAEGAPDVRISHIAYDRDHTHARDARTWFPLDALKAVAAAGDIGALSPRFFGLPTNRSRKTTLMQDCPRLLELLREDGLDAAVIVPNCPVCHQSASLAARHLEANGIATVVMGCAKDIVEHAGVPRFLFSDFPLGNAAGRPDDTASQSFTLDLALKLLVAAPGPRTTTQSPLMWSDNESWKLDYCNIERLSSEELSRRRKAFDESKRVAKLKRV